MVSAVEVPSTLGFTSAASLDAVYGGGTAARVHSSRILVVGAGGVGCELVKNLASTGFSHITLIDLDTIDVSNLNRQFLFRKHHVGKSKAVEAAATITTMVPSTEIEGVVGNIKDTKFGISFFKSFNIVCCALDNLEARRHVNRMCLAADVPMIESGSTGYVGQTSVVAKGFECYDCTTRPQPKSYAVCTIRSTPEKPVHCVVWAKFLYELIFGSDDDGNVLKDLDMDMGRAASEASASIPDTEETGPNENPKKGKEPVKAPQANGHENGHSEQSTENNGTVIGAKSRRMRYAEGEDPEEFAKRVCKLVFVTDIEKQRKMTELWQERAPPLVYDVGGVVDKLSEEIKQPNLSDQTAWTKERSAVVFRETLKHIASHRKEEVGSLTFDKDDKDALMFVCAASNLRSHAYGVPLQSPFAVKGIAGNIVHAIATTNAVVGGLIVLEALKVMANNGDVRDCLTTFVSKAPVGARVMKILYPEQLRKKNEKCFVCSKGHLQLILDLEKTKLRTVVNTVLQKRMCVLQPTVNLTAGEYHNTLYECGVGLEEDEIEEYEQNLEKSLQELRVTDGSELVVSDLAQNLTCTVHVSHVSGLYEDKAEWERFKLEGKIQEAEIDTNGVRSEEDSTEDVDDECLEVPVQEMEGSRASAPNTSITIADEASVTVTAEGEGQGSKKRSLDHAENGRLDGEPETKKMRGEERESMEPENR